MNYLTASEYEAHGLEATTAAAWVTAASALIDAHCRRPTLAVAQYTERLRIAPGRNSARLTYLPLAVVEPMVTPIIAARARYAATSLEAFGYDVAQAFALPGTWTALDVNAIDYCAETGEITLHANALGLRFEEIEVTYKAGLQAMPDAVKVACAQIVRNALATPALNVRAGTIDRMSLEYFGDTLLDGDVRALLAPWVAQKL